MLHKAHRDALRSSPAAQISSGEAAQANSAFDLDTGDLYLIESELSRGRDMLLAAAARIDTLKRRAKESEARETAIAAAEQTMMARIQDLEGQLSALHIEIAASKAPGALKYVPNTDNAEADSLRKELESARRVVEASQKETADWVLECETLLSQIQRQSADSITILGERDELQRLIRTLRDERDAILAELRISNATLAAEQQANESLIAALGEVQEYAAGFEAHVAEISDVRAALTQAADDGYEAFRSASARAAESHRATVSIAAHLDDVSDEAQRLSHALAEQRAAYTALEQLLINEREQARRENADLAAALTSAQELLRGNRTTIDEAEKTMLRLEAELSQRESAAISLNDHISQKDKETVQAIARASRLEQQLATLRDDKESLEAELEAVRKAAISEKLVLGEYIATLRDQVADIAALREAHRLLVAQTEEFIADLQSEGAQISTLIDAVQTSHFWKIKRFLNRLRARMFRR